MQRSEEQVRHAARTLQRAFLLGILLQTAIGFVLGSAFESSFSSELRWLIPIGVGVVSISHVAVALGLALPKSAQQKELTADGAAALGYALVDVPSMFGILAAIFASNGLVALPFGALSLVGWAAVRNFIADRYHETMSASDG